MRRVSWVRITVDGEGAHCEVLGVGHRLPAVRPVSLETALGLAASGGSTASGCATAVNDSTASGSPCPPAAGATTTTVRPPTTGTTPPGATTASAARSLALTGSSSGQLAALALGALAIGGLLVLVGSRRPQEG